jgi:NAD(P)H-hydrate repair Nnr-like enzyme with NAD(P)H-hydrate epimerase domain
MIRMYCYGRLRAVGAVHWIPLVGGGDSGGDGAARRRWLAAVAARSAQRGERRPRHAVHSLAYSIT